MDAGECFCQMVDELGDETDARDEQAEWVLDFKRRCSMKLESLADTAMSAERYDDAISRYSAALSLNPATPQGLLIKRSGACLARGWCEEALDDANKAIVLDPSSPWGYEAKHMALHKAGDHGNAINAFEMMLSKMSRSPDLEIREHHRRYVNPEETKATIRKAIQVAIRESPRVLINTTSGRLCNKLEQAAAFESLPVFTELISSMTTQIDHARIEQEVANYYRYTTFSHKWEDNEPLFEKVLHIVVYDLEESPTHDKLHMFCKIVREAGFHWAWSDTCCINKMDHFVLQEALVAMFKWYQGSSLTIIFLRGVHSPSRRGDLTRSIWNTRAWTFQEYHASKVVRFYTEDWTPYLDLDIPNHKDSPEIISEMQEATGVSARALSALRPGFDDIREKLCLASRRQTSLVEDAAYSLLGIFSISFPVVYGEGDQALGRLLAQLLTSAGDTSILAWTGRSGSFNSCLASNITVFNQLSTSHIPSAVNSAQMETITTRLQASSLDFTLVMTLYDRLNELPVVLFVGQRLKLPCITFKLGPLSASRSESGYIFRAETPAIGIVEITTEEDLSQLDSLYLIHPWIDFLLDRQPVGSLTETVLENTDDRCLVGVPSFDGPAGITSAVTQTRTARLVARLGRPFVGRSTTRDFVSLGPPSSDKQLRALRVLVRLTQPFGALLLTPNPGHVAAHRRVAADSLVTVQVEKITPTVLNKLVNSVRILDVL
ncbi:hypothetical protein EV363DRAFT_710056 [Boletus edulis]|nr:hypothetical protein EV363DRAFT_710056 [Boletus edulis]